MATLLDFVPNLRKRGREYVGPCPFCREGDDRFVVSPDKGRDGTGLFWCRRCNKGGDAITYLREVDGLSYWEALDALGLIVYGSPEHQRLLNERWAATDALKRQPEPDVSDDIARRADTYFSSDQDD